MIIRHQLGQPSTHRPPGGNAASESQRPEADIELISNDLDFLVPLLRKYPKCYWIWNYRLWLLGEASRRLPVPDSLKLWQRELDLVGKMLGLDNRNFHGWRYRRVVILGLESNYLKVQEKAKSLTVDEFDYATRMIKSNLSNFSAWHARSQLIPRLLDERQASHFERELFLNKGWHQQYINIT